MCNLSKLLRGWSSGSQAAEPRYQVIGSETVKETKNVKEMTAFSGGAETIQALPAVWQGQQGRKRVTGEFLYLKSVELPWIYDLQIFGTMGMTWRLKLKNFPKGTKGGRELNADLDKLWREHAQDHLLMEIDFPTNYPQSPPFMRIVSPKTEWYTGFVSCDGALLLEPLTVQGWQGNLCIEDVLVAAIYAMTDCEKGRVQPGSVEGNGGDSGPLRVHFDTQSPANVLLENDKDSAKASFSRMEAAAARNGFSY